MLTPQTDTVLVEVFLCSTVQVLGTVGIKTPHSARHSPMFCRARRGERIRMDIGMKAQWTGRTEDADSNQGLLAHCRLYYFLPNARSTPSATKAPCVHPSHRERLAYPPLLSRSPASERFPSSLRASFFNCRAVT